MKISIKQYSQTLFELTDGKSESEVLDAVKKFFERLKADGQIKNVNGIIGKFSEFHNDSYGIVEARITSRSELGKEEKEKIENFIGKKYGAKKVEIENIIDEKIKGGIIIKVGDEVLDASISGQLKRLRNKLVS